MPGNERVPRHDMGPGVGQEPGRDSRLGGESESGKGQLDRSLGGCKSLEVHCYNVLYCQ